VFIEQVVSLGLVSQLDMFGKRLSNPLNAPLVKDTDHQDPTYCKCTRLEYS
jgi:hypothetical protein